MAVHASLVGVRVGVTISVLVHERTVAEPKPVQATDGRIAGTTYATPSRGGEAGRERWWLVCGILETLIAGR